MAPTKKSRVNKRYGSAISYSPEKEVGNSAKNKQRGSISFSPDGGNSNKSLQRKKKLSDKLGSQWSKGELERFYDAYRKYGKDWRKVAAAVRNRTVEMVEALYSMNRAYLSLPEGTASVVGLIAMMTDHYNVLEGSDSDQESNDGSGISRKLPNRKRGRDNFNTSKDLFQSHSVASTDGCLSLLKRKRSDGSQPRVVGKRTPRFPVSYSHKRDYRENQMSPNRKGKKAENDNDDAHVAALALTEASQRSSQRLRDTSVDDDWFEGSVGSRGAENGDYGKDTSSLMAMEGVGTVEVHQKGKKFYGKKEKVEDDDGGEACSGTEEGKSISGLKGIIGVEFSNAKVERVSPQSQRKKSKKLFFGDESSAIDALQTLANLSLMMPPCTVESESSVQLKEERTTLDAEEKSSVPEATSQVRNKNKLSGAKQKAPPTISKKSTLGRDANGDIINDSTTGQLLSENKLLKRRRKSSIPKMSKVEARLDAILKGTFKTEVICEEESKPVIKGKRSSQSSTPSKQWKSVGSSEGSLSGEFKRTGSGTDLAVSTTQVPAASQVNLPTKQRSKRKMYLPQTLPTKDIKSTQNIVKRKVNKNFTLPEEKLSCFLSSTMVRRWCTFEWFYSAIDYPWFAKREFEEYLNHVGLGHIPRLTRVEWGVIRSSLGKPRRFSELFLREERKKLKQYRESVREHYTELRNGVREGLPTDLARPLTVGQRVIAIHPKTREVHDGSVLTVDHDKCRIQFDHPDIGVEFVMDVDCMPSNPMENMPESLRRQNSTIDNFSLTSKEPLPNGNLNFGGPLMFASSGHMEKGPTSINTLGKHGKVSSALHDLRQRNTHPGNVLFPGPKIPINSTTHSNVPSSFDNFSISQDSASNLIEIVKGSTIKAQSMVDAAIQAFSLCKEGEDAYLKIREALDSMDNKLMTSESRALTNKPHEQVNGTSVHRYSLIKSEPVITGDSSASNLRTDSDKSEAKVPSGIITSCVASLLMIQTCTERQYPPSEVAQILDTAVTRLYPLSSQNIQIYREIQSYMGRIKTQILALVPT
ncbi:protein ALWAYS EARLY 2 isoform X9 [Cannabis sativa]|uniref:protein ALWAYS EARLY 2 isoform X9 n=1 Tax=Cannabis sativa TaxID=3483 RepID=UPI0029C9F385|nr:protein ALWAYS EARLY 2 isoform X9 [Cannabis sativa]XP_060966821.1 protein ALWAYS EARLY 2 isoform X9 [Cannabis sativa]